MAPKKNYPVTGEKRPDLAGKKNVESQRKIYGRNVTIITSYDDKGNVMMSGVKPGQEYGPGYLAGLRPSLPPPGGGAQHNYLRQLQGLDPLPKSKTNARQYNLAPPSPFGSTVPYYVQGPPGIPTGKGDVDSMGRPIQGVPSYGSNKIGPDGNADPAGNRTNVTGTIPDPPVLDSGPVDDFGIPLNPNPLSQVAGSTQLEAAQGQGADQGQGNGSTMPGATFAKYTPDQAINLGQPVYNSAGQLTGHWTSKDGFVSLAQSGAAYQATAQGATLAKAGSYRPTIPSATPGSTLPGGYVDPQFGGTMGQGGTQPEPGFFDPAAYAAIREGGAEDPVRSGMGLQMSGPLPLDPQLSDSPLLNRLLGQVEDILQHDPSVEGSFKYKFTEPERVSIESQEVIALELGLIEEEDRGKVLLDPEFAANVRGMVLNAAKEGYEQMGGRWGDATSKQLEESFATEISQLDAISVDTRIDEASVKAIGQDEYNFRRSAGKTSEEIQAEIATDIESHPDKYAHLDDETKNAIIGLDAAAITAGAQDYIPKFSEADYASYRDDKTISFWTGLGGGGFDPANTEAIIAAPIPASPKDIPGYKWNGNTFRFELKDDWDAPDAETRDRIWQVGEMYRQAVANYNFKRPLAEKELALKQETAQGQRELQATYNKYTEAIRGGNISEGAAMLFSIKEQEKIINAKEIQLGTHNQLMTLISNPQVMVRARRMGLLGELSAQLGIDLKFPEPSSDEDVIAMMQALGPLSSAQLIPRLSEIATLTGWTLEDLVGLVQRSSPFGGGGGGGGGGRSSGSVRTTTRGGR